MKGRAQHDGEEDQLLNMKTPVLSDVNNCQRFWMKADCVSKNQEFVVE